MLLIHLVYLFSYRYQTLLSFLSATPATPTTPTTNATDCRTNGTNGTNRNFRSTWICQNYRVLTLSWTKSIKLCLLLWLGFLKTMKPLLSVLRDFSTRCCEIGFGSSPGGYSKKFYTGRLRPEAQPAYPFIYHFFRKGTSFVYVLLEKRHPFYIPS